MSNKFVRNLLQDLVLLVVDDNVFMRRLTRMMLINLGAKQVYEAADGLAALEIVRNLDPDIMLLDHEIPVVNGTELLRIVRSPELFPRPNLPVIMLTNHPRQSDIIEALRLGVHEVLVTPTSPQALQDRLLSIIAKPRPMVRIGPYYVPKPRRMLAQATMH